jgi:hypothetical protein
MRELYEKPAMATEDVDIGALVANVGSLIPLGSTLPSPLDPCDDCEPL